MGNLTVEWVVLGAQASRLWWNRLSLSQRCSKEDPNVALIANDHINQFLEFASDGWNSIKVDVKFVVLVIVPTSLIAAIFIVYMILVTTGFVVATSFWSWQGSLMQLPLCLVTFFFFSFLPCYPCRFCNGFSQGYDYPIILGSSPFLLLQVKIPRLQAKRSNAII